MAERETIEEFATAHPSLDFPGRSKITLQEMSQKIMVCERHLLNLIDEGSLKATLAEGIRSRRAATRVTRKAWLRFLQSRLFSHMRNQRSRRAGALQNG